MTTCSRCGHEATGAYCGNCGAPMSGGGHDDATRTAGTQQAPRHSEGWQDGSTYAGGGGYEAYRRTSSNPSNTPYYSSAPTGSGAVPPEGSNKRSNQMLATLVGVAAVAVCALVAYLFLKPGDDHSSSAPSANASVANSSAGSSSLSQGGSPESSTTGNQGQQAPTTTYVTPTSNPGWGSISNLVDQSGDFGVSESGSTATVYKDSGSGPQSVGTVHLNGHRGTGVELEKLSFIQLPGCQSPILVWNAGAANASGAFGDDGTGHYQLFQNTPGGDLAPTGGDGSAANEFGVYDNDGHIAYRDKKATPPGQYNEFDSCTSDGYGLSFAGQGS